MASLIVKPRFILIFIWALSATSGASSNFDISARNREVGNKWTYLQLQASQSQATTPNLPVKHYYGTSTTASPPTKRSTTSIATTRRTPRPTTATLVTKPTQKTTTQKPITGITIPNRDNACGLAVAKPLHTPYVIGGQLAHSGEFPWFGALTKFNYTPKSKWKVICGASILNARYAITAAHCLHGRYKDQLEIVFNLQDATNISYHASNGEIRRKITRFVIHPDYNRETQHDDIALIQFKEPLDLRREKFLVPICLPERADNSYASRTAVFVGFGHTSYGSSSSKENSKDLMKVQVPVLSHSECLKSKIPTKKNITENMVCAGEQGRDACINDSGGPLMVFEQNRVVLVGLASWGVGCALPDYPGVYTRVSKYTSWIQSALAS